MALSSVCEIVRSSKLRVAVSRGAVHGQSGLQCEQTFESWVKANGLVEKFDAPKVFRKLNFFVFEHRDTVKAFLEAFADSTSAYGKGDAMQVVRLAPDLLLVAYHKVDQRKVKLPGVPARRFTFPLMSQMDVQVVTALTSMGRLGFEWLGNIHVDSYEGDLAEDSFADIGAMTRLQMHSERCKATLVAPRDRTATQKMLVTNMADLKELRASSQLFQEGILHSFVNGSHRRLHDYAAVQPGEYSAMSTMPLEWSQWNHFTDRWESTSAQAYLGTGLHLKKSLVMMGLAGRGKTEFAKALASELTDLHAKYGNGSGAFGLVKGVEAAIVLENVMHQRFVLIWDDVHAGESRTKKTSLAQFLKSLVGQDTPQQILCRILKGGEGMVRLPLQCIRLFTINDTKIEDWAKDQDEELTLEHLHAVYRRLVICKVTRALYTADQADQYEADEVDDDLAEGFRAMALRRSGAAQSSS